MNSLVRNTLSLAVALFTVAAFAATDRTDVKPTMESMGAQSKILGKGFTNGDAAATLLPAANALATLVDEAAQQAPKELLDGSASSAQQLVRYDALIAQLKVQTGLLVEALTQGNLARAADIYNKDIRALQQTGHKEFRK
jgi:hypothetical protein